MSEQRKFRFTETRVREIGAALKGRDSYYDTDFPDLELRVTDKGTKSFYIYAWSSKLHRPLRVFLGKWPSLNVEEARRLAKKQIGEIADGKDPNKAKQTAREELTLGTARESYFESLRLAERKPRTLQLYEYMDQRFLSAWHSKKLSAINADMILGLRRRIRDEDGSRATARVGTRQEKSNRKVTANRTIRLLSQIFNHSIRKGWDGKNPCEQIDPFPEQAARRCLEEHEIGPFIAACEKIASDGDQLGDYFLVCLFSGIRRRNVASMKWSQVNLEQGTWDVPETKNGLPVRVYVSTQLREILQRRYMQRGFSQFVFASSESATGYINEPRKGLERVRELSGIQGDKITVHSLKHTFITYAYDCGLNPVVVSRLGGHRIPGITGRYGHATEQKIREAYQRVAAHMQNAAKHNSPLAIFSSN